MREKYLLHLTQWEESEYDDGIIYVSKESIMLCGNLLYYYTLGVTKYGWGNEPQDVKPDLRVQQERAGLPRQQYFSSKPDQFTEAIEYFKKAERSVA